LQFLASLLLLIFNVSSYSQTFFESAEGEGVISIRNSTVSQFKFNLNSTSITFGYYYIGPKTTEPGGFILNLEAKAKPNNQGIATLVKTGKLQPGIKFSSALGYRWKRLLQNWSVLDLYIKPEYSYNGYTIFDTLRQQTNEEPFYRVNKSSFAINAVINFGFAVSSYNVFIGAQVGRYWDYNADELDDVTLQTLTLYPNSTSRYVFSDIEEAKAGHLEKRNKTPFAADLVVDPGLELGNSPGDNTKLGAFTYFRSNGTGNRYRNGFGLCLLSQQNPSKIYTSLGYELPAYGKGVTPGNRKKDNGVVFVSVGYSIF
jgi:hypothetical protein